MPLTKRRHSRERWKLVATDHTLHGSLSRTLDTLHHDRAGVRVGSASGQTKAYQKAHVL